jgi:hypothetical protein
MEDNVCSWVIQGLVLLVVMSARCRAWGKFHGLQRLVGELFFWVGAWRLEGGRPWMRSPT